MYRPGRRRRRRRALVFSHSRRLLGGEKKSMVERTNVTLLLKLESSQAVHARRCCRATHRQRPAHWGR